MKNWIRALIGLTIIMTTTGARAADRWEVRNDSSSGLCRIDKTTAAPDGDKRAGPFDTKQAACKAASDLYDETLTDHSRCTNYVQGTIDMCKVQKVALPPLRLHGRERNLRRHTLRDVADYTVPGIVPAIAQPTDNTCWATVATIMSNWNTSQSQSIETVMTAAGFKYLTLFQADNGLLGSDKPAFLHASGMVAEVPQSFTPEGWVQLLRTYGPLWVTTNEGTSKNFAIHARVIVGVKGDLDHASATILTIINPAGGKTDHESLLTFVQKLESVAKDDLGSGADLRPQVVHFPAARVRAKTSEKGQKVTKELKVSVQLSDDSAQATVTFKLSDSTWTSTADNGVFKISSGPYIVKGGSATELLRTGGGLRVGRFTNLDPATVAATGSGQGLSDDVGTSFSWNVTQITK